MKGKKVSEFNQYLTNMSDLKEAKCSAKSVEEFNNLLEEMLQVWAAFEISNLAMSYTEDTHDNKTKWNEIYQMKLV